MATFALIAQACADLELRARVAPALVRVALDVLGETVPGEDADMTARTAQAKRRSRASEVLADPEAEAARAHWAICCWRASSLADTYGTPDGIVTDGDIEYLILAVWDSLAGA